jgi:hypothetical protein
MQQANNKDNLLISYLNLRIALGFVGIFLPIILVTGSFLFNDCRQIQPSISHYYYTAMGNYFVGSLCAVSMFLFFYKGYDKIDNIIAKIAALCALLVAFFPTDKYEDSLCAFVTNNRDVSVEWIHYSAAAILFISFAVFSFYLFTKTGPVAIMTANKKTRNKVFKTCGIVIVVSIVMIAACNFIPALKELVGKYRPTLVFESTALFAFGTSWIAKGEMFLKDK